MKKQTMIVIWYKEDKLIYFFQLISDFYKKFIKISQGKNQQFSKQLIS